jgi:hypothetical protein
VNVLVWLCVCIGGCMWVYLAEWNHQPATASFRLPLHYCSCPIPHTHAHTRICTHSHTHIPRVAGVGVPCSASLPGRQGRGRPGGIAVFNVCWARVSVCLCVLGGRGEQRGRSPSVGGWGSIDQSRSRRDARRAGIGVLNDGVHDSSFHFTLQLTMNLSKLPATSCVGWMRGWMDDVLG